MAKKIILIAGPSGAGKTTISEYLTDRYQIPRVITHTTRPKRPGKAGQLIILKTMLLLLSCTSLNMSNTETTSTGPVKKGWKEPGLRTTWSA